jgi:hypothetical protein
MDSILSYESAEFDKIESATETLLAKHKSILEAKTGLIEARVISSLRKAYLKTSYDVAQIIVHHSPSILGTLSAIWGVIKTVYKAVSWVVSTFHVKEIIQLIQLARKISPKFRRWTNELLRGIKDIAETIGVGAATMNNVLHSLQSLLNATGAMLGKDWQWVEGRYADKALSTVEKMKTWGLELKNNPAAFVDDVFIDENIEHQIELGDGWNNVWNGIEKGVNWASDALDKTQDLTDALNELENALPDKIKKFIPDSVWDGIEEAQQMINNVLEPRLNKVEKALSIIDSAVTQRKKEINNIVDRLALPGDYINEIDQLDERLRELQQSKIDDQSGSQYNREATEANNETSDVFNEMVRIAEAGIPPGQSPSFLGLEPASNPRPPGAQTGQYETWFVGDY